VEAVYEISPSSADTMSAFSTCFHTVNLQRPTFAGGFLTPFSTASRRSSAASSSTAAAAAMRDTIM